jgi:hypothetical protein
MADARPSRTWRSRMPMLREDPHLWASALHDELRGLGYPGSYQRLTHELRARRLRPRCLCLRDRLSSPPSRSRPGCG